MTEKKLVNPPSDESMLTKDNTEESPATPQVTQSFGAERPKYSDDDKKKFVVLKEKLGPNHTRNVATEAKACAIIERDRLFEIDGFKDFNEFMKQYDFDRTYLFHLNIYGRWLITHKIPEGMEPSESAIRPMLKTCFHDEDRDVIYGQACVRKQEREKKKGKKTASFRADSNSRNVNAPVPVRGISANKNEEPASDAEDDENDENSNEKDDEMVVYAENLNVIPDRQDILNAIMMFKKKNRGDKLYLTCIDEAIEPGIMFKNVLDMFPKKLKDVHSVLTCMKQFLVANNANNVDADTQEAVKMHIDKLLKTAQKEMEDAFTWTHKTAQNTK